MSTIKKAYKELNTLLAQALKAKKIDGEVYNQALKLMEAKKSGGGSASNSIKDQDGNVVAIKCYYFKRWMPLVGDKKVEFGAKKTSSTGYNTMSKEGNKLWTKQLSDSKKANNDLLSRVASGKLKPQDIPNEQAKIEKARKLVAKTDLGFAKQAEVETYLKAQKIKL